MADDGRFVIYNRASEALGRSDREVFGDDQADLFRVQNEVALRLGVVETSRTRRFAVRTEACGESRPARWHSRTVPTLAHATCSACART